MFMKMRRYFKYYTVVLICGLTVLLLLIKSQSNSWTHHVMDEDQSLPQYPADTGPRKVIFLSYMRSGSTFLGELSQQNPRHLYWYEPLDGLYSALYGIMPGWYPLDIAYFTNGTARRLPKFERDFLTQNIHRILNCDFNHVPAETLAGYDIFRRNIKSMGAFEQCLQNTTTQYKSSTLNNHVSHKSKPQWLNSKHCEDRPIQKIYCCKYSLEKLCGRYFDGVMHNRLNKCHQYTNGTNGKFDSWVRPKIQKQFNDHNICIKMYDTRIKPCLSLLTNMCLASEARVTKTIRLTMKTVEQLLKKDPHIKIVHLLRDPRGIVNSRNRGSLLSGVAKVLSKDSSVSVVAEEARLLCEKMLQDIKKRQKLERSYPQNFQVVSYEKMSQHPLETYHQLYAFMGLPKSDSVKSWLQQAVDAETDDWSFGTQRKNATETSIQWKKELSAWETINIDDECTEVLDYLSTL